jgi:NADP-dependent 3-hydroxy acid dehydrogenase YdfG
MSEWNDDDYLVGVLGKVAKYVEQSGAPGTAFVVARAAERLKELHDRLAAIEQANAERSAITERYYQQAVEETRDYGND